MTPQAVGVSLTVARDVFLSTDEARGTAKLPWIASSLSSGGSAVASSCELLQFDPPQPGHVAAGADWRSRAEEVVTESGGSGGFSSSEHFADTKFSFLPDAADASEAAKIAAPAAVAGGFLVLHAKPATGVLINREIGKVIAAAGTSPERLIYQPELIGPQSEHLHDGAQSALFGTVGLQYNYVERRPVQQAFQIGSWVRVPPHLRTAQGAAQNLRVGHLARVVAFPIVAQGVGAAGPTLPQSPAITIQFVVSGITETVLLRTVPFASGLSVRCYPLELAYAVDFTVAPSIGSQPVVIVMEEPAKEVGVTRFAPSSSPSPCSSSSSSSGTAHKSALISPVVLCALFGHHTATRFVRLTHHDGRNATVASWMDLNCAWDPTYCKAMAAASQQAGRSAVEAATLPRELRALRHANAKMFDSSGQLLLTAPPVSISLPGVINQKCSFWPTTVALLCLLRAGKPEIAKGILKTAEQRILAAPYLTSFLTAGIVSAAVGDGSEGVRLSIAAAADMRSSITGLAPATADDGIALAVQQACSGKQLSREELAALLPFVFTGGLHGRLLRPPAVITGSSASSTSTSASSSSSASSSIAASALANAMLAPDVFRSFKGRQPPSKKPQPKVGSKRRRELYLNRLFDEDDDDDDDGGEDGDGASDDDGGGIDALVDALAESEQLALQFARLFGTAYSCSALCDSGHTSHKGIILQAVVEVTLQSSWANEDGGSVESDALTKVSIAVGNAVKEWYRAANVTGEAMGPGLKCETCGKALKTFSRIRDGEAPRVLFIKVTWKSDAPALAPSSHASHPVHAIPLRCDFKLEDQSYEYGLCCTIGRHATGPKARALVCSGFMQGFAPNDLPGFVNVSADLTNTDQSSGLHATPITPVASIVNLNALLFPPKEREIDWLVMVRDYSPKERIQQAIRKGRSAQGAAASEE